MRRALCFVLIVPLAGCGSCGSDEPRESTRPPPLPEEVEPIAEPEPDPCVESDAALAAWDEGAVVATEDLPTSAGGEALGDGPIVRVGETVHLGGVSLGTVDEAVLALQGANLATDESTLTLALRATDPVSRVAPILEAFEDMTFALVMVETDRETECRLLRQVSFGLKTDEDHGWVTFPTNRPVSDLLTALGGADQPRRVQLMQ